ncbi:histidinol-phosphate transaminase [Chondrinema litorale]|nr:histidinol-phosphate transaminase [Chondrinema litorale]UZR92860.1 histidinol-phosphate transaminase [Chondrinema litorale]
MPTNTFNIESIVRPHILKLKPYSSARDEYTGKSGVFLDANENPFGSVSGEAFNRYPDPLQKAVKEKLAIIKEVKPEQIFLGNGSDEAIDLLFRAFCEPQKDKVLLLPPTYGMYKVSADINLVETLEIPLTTEYQLDTEKILSLIEKENKVKLIFVCSPNNPTGNQINLAEIEKILNNFSGLVVVDEAYIDFAPEKSMVHFLDKYPNLIVLQTFSKAWGMAALRIGMAYASKQIIDLLNKIKPPYNINQLTQEKVLEALDANELRKQKVEELITLRENLKNALLEMPLVEKVYPSDANFLLIKVPEATKIYDKLIKQLVIVRNRSSVILCDNCLRITVGTAEENTKLLKALAEI